MQHEHPLCVPLLLTALWQSVKVYVCLCMSFQVFVCERNYTKFIGGTFKSCQGMTPFRFSCIACLGRTRLGLSRTFGPQKRWTMHCVNACIILYVIYKCLCGIDDDNVGDGAGGSNDYDLSRTSCALYSRPYYALSYACKTCNTDDKYEYIIIMHWMRNMKIDFWILLQLLLMPEHSVCVRVCDCALIKNAYFPFGVSATHSESNVGVIYRLKNLFHLRSKTSTNSPFNALIRTI